MMKLREDNSPNVPKLVALEEAEFEISLFKVIAMLTYLSAWQILSYPVRLN